MILIIIGRRCSRVIMVVRVVDMVVVMVVDMDSMVMRERGDLDLGDIMEEEEEECPCHRVEEDLVVEGEEDLVVEGDGGRQGVVEGGLEEEIGGEGEDIVEGFVVGEVVGGEEGGRLGVVVADMGISLIIKVLI